MLELKFSLKLKEKSMGRNFWPTLYFVIVIHTFRLVSKFQNRKHNKRVMLEFKFSLKLKKKIGSKKLLAHPVFNYVIIIYSLRLVFKFQSVLHDTRSMDACGGPQTFKYLREPVRINCFSNSLGVSLHLVFSCIFCNICRVWNSLWNAVCLEWLIRMNDTSQLERRGIIYGIRNNYLCLRVIAPLLLLLMV